MRFLLGIDEAGRGPLAGPVAVGAVLVEEGYDILAAFPGLNDSKKLSEKKRDALHDLLMEEGKKGNLRSCVAYASESVIDRRGIAVAVKDALTRAVRKLVPLETSVSSLALTGHAPSVSNVHIYLDGSLKAPEGYVQETIIGGDGTVPAIMLGALAAKVARDRLMKKLAEEYPAYAFEVHKGYGTKLHYERLRLYGASPVHRKSFLKSLALDAA